MAMLVITRGYPFVADRKPTKRQPRPVTRYGPRSSELRVMSSKSPGCRDYEVGGFFAIQKMPIHRPTFDWLMANDGKLRHNTLWFCSQKVVMGRFRTKLMGSDWQKVVVWCFIKKEEWIDKNWHLHNKLRVGVSYCIASWHCFSGGLSDKHEITNKNSSRLYWIFTRLHLEVQQVTVKIPTNGGSILTYYVTRWRMTPGLTKKGLLKNIENGFHTIPIYKLYLQSYSYGTCGRGPECTIHKENLASGNFR